MVIGNSEMSRQPETVISFANEKERQSLRTTNRKVDWKGKRRDGGEMPHRLGRCIERHSRGTATEVNQTREGKLGKLGKGRRKGEGG